MIWQSEALGLKSSEVAVNLGIDHTTVWRTVTLFRDTGDVQKKSYPRSSIVTKLTPTIEYIIVHQTFKRPGILLREIQAHLVEQTGVDVCLSTICRFLHKIGFTRQKLKIAALQRDDFLRSQFVSDVSMYEPEMLIFLDESGSDRWDSIRDMVTVYEGNH